MVFGNLVYFTKCYADIFLYLLVDLDDLFESL